MSNKNCKHCEKVLYRFRHKSLKCILDQNDMISLDIIENYCEEMTTCHLKYCGECEILDKHFVAHYVCNHKLYLRIDNTTCPFSDVMFKYKKLLYKRRELEITIGDEKHIKIKYKLKKHWDYFYDLDEEDLDYGLFLFNIKKNKNKAKTMIDAYMGIY